MAIFDNLFGAPPEYLTGLLGADETDKLRKQAMTTGLVNSAIALIAQPRNQRYGSALPYIGKALMAGQQAGQNVYSNALQGLETQQKLAEYKRQQEQRKQFDEAAKGLYTKTPAQYQTVTQAGGYAPAQTEIQTGQTAPNFGMTRLPDTTQQVMTAPEQSQLNQEALQKMIISGDPRAASYLTGLKTMSEITNPKTDNPFAKIDPKDFTQDSIKTFSQTGNYQDLIPISKEQKPKDFGVNYEAQSLATYQKPFNELMPQQQQTIINTVEGRAADKAPKISVNLSDPTAVAKVGLDLSERSQKFYQTDIDTANQYKIIDSLVKNPSPTGDTTLLYSFFKVLDPASTVREGEIQMVVGNRSIPQQFRGYAQKLAGGGSLLPKERQEILSVAKKRVEARKTQVDKTRKAFVDNAKRLNLDPDIYVPNPYGEISQSVEVDY
jgi:hypothetical protein